MSNMTRILWAKVKRSVYDSRKDVSVLFWMGLKMSRENAGKYVVL